MDAIDLYQIYRPQPAEDIGERWAELAALKDEGTSRWIGVSNFAADQLEEIRAIAPVTSLQPPYSLLRREAEESVLPYCRERGIGVIAYSPMASGLLTGAMTRERIADLPADDRRARDLDFRAPRLSVNLLLVERLRAIGRHGLSAGAARSVPRDRDRGRRPVRPERTD